MNFLVNTNSTNRAVKKKVLKIVLIFRMVLIVLLLNVVVNCLCLCFRKMLFFMLMLIALGLSILVGLVWLVFVCWRWRLLCLLRKRALQDETLVLANLNPGVNPGDVPVPSVFNIVDGDGVHACKA